MIRILIAEFTIGMHLGRVELPSSERREGMRCDRPRQENRATPACALKGGADADGRGRATDGKRLLAALRQIKLLPRLRECVADSFSQKHELASICLNGEVILSKLPDLARG